GGLAALGVRQPTLGQVQLAVYHAVEPAASGRGGIGQVDGDLRVVDLAGGAGVLATHPDDVAALLEDAGLVDHHHPGGATQVLPQVARGRSANSPSPNALARRRGSTRPNRAATRLSSSSGPACHLAGSMLRPASPV